MTDNNIKFLDIFVKGVAGSLIAGAVTFYGFKVESIRERTAEDAKAVQAAIELTSKQKDLDVDLGMRMFGALVDNYFKKNTPAGAGTHVRERMVLLRLVALNFQDVPINLKPLFDDLDGQVSSEKDRQKLQDIAKEVARRQAFRLTAESGFDSGPITVKKGNEVRFDNLLTKLRIEEVGRDSVRVSILSELIDKKGSTKEGSVGPFSVGYFDSPIVDNTKLGEYRFSLVLIKAPTQRACPTCDEAQVRFVAFPEHLAPDRFDIKELSRAFRDRKAR